MRYSSKQTYGPIPRKNRVLFMGVVPGIVGGGGEAKVANSAQVQPAGHEGGGFFAPRRPTVLTRGTFAFSRTSWEGAATARTLSALE